jgi:nucleoside-diphosphate-sugar epimerase
MGFETFKVLWERRDQYHITLLLLPLPREKKMFQPYIRKAKADELRIVWGDATQYADVQDAIRGAEYVLDAMALIPPMADYYPEKAKKVNVDGLANIVQAIGKEPDGNARIKLAYTGTVAETGDRLPPVHWGRVGDPLKPSMFDYYAVTKIAGERLVLESDIQHWVSLRMTGIMPVHARDLVFRDADPLGFHMPPNACMENITNRDAGLGLANVVEIPDDSDFWRGIYNMGGGPKMRLPAYDFYKKSFTLFGIADLAQVFDRNWYAARNFHMQYYVDSEKCDEYLHYWRDSTEDWMDMMEKTLPLGLKIVRKLAFLSPFIQKKLTARVRETNKKMLENHRNGTLYWRKHGNTKRLDAFYGGQEAYDKLPGWDALSPELCYGDEEPALLDHGYDKSKAVLDLEDLRGAAAFRGGRCLSEAWDGDMFSPVEWECAFGHRFTAKPTTVLKGGHWCPECEAPDWDFKRIAAKNPFFNQVVAPFAEGLPDYPITEADLDDIKGADRDEWAMA